MDRSYQFSMLTTLVTATNRSRSTLRAHRLLRVASSVSKRELGTLSPSFQTKVTEALRQLFQISEPVKKSP